MSTSHLEAAVRTIIASACAHHEPLDRDGLIDTPRRVSKAWLAMAAAHAPISRSFSTNSMDSASASAPPSDIIRSALFDEPDVGDLGFVLVKDITFACLNRDTLLPMYGKCHVAYIPRDGSIIGLSKLSRVVSSVCSRSLLSPHELCQSVINMISEFSSGVAVGVRSNYGLFTRRRGLDGPLFEELLVLVDVDAEEGTCLADGDDVDGCRRDHIDGTGTNDENHAAIARAVGTLLEGIGEDATSTSSIRSASSYASWFLDATSGYYVGEVDDLAAFDHGGATTTTTTTPTTTGCDPATMAFAIPFTSQCEHHLLPFAGHIGIMLVGAKAGADLVADPALAARVEGVCSYHVSRFSKRLQVQERLTQQVANILWERLRPLCHHLIVLVECKHLCMIARGVQQHCSATVTQTIRSEAAADLAVRRLELMRALRRKIVSEGAASKPPAAVL